MSVALYFPRSYGLFNEDMVDSKWDTPLKLSASRHLSQSSELWHFPRGHGSPPDRGLGSKAFAVPTITSFNDINFCDVTRAKGGRRGVPPRGHYTYQSHLPRSKRWASPWVGRGLSRIAAGVVEVCVLVSEQHEFHAHLPHPT